MKIIINPEYEELEYFVRQIPDIFEHAGTIIFKGRNILKRFEVNGLRIIVKRFKVPHFLNRIVYSFIRKSKANRSYTYALRLIEKGINTPSPIAYIEEFKGGLLHYSYYLSIEITNAHEIREFYFKPELENCPYVLGAFGTFTAQLHNKNILHEDYSSGNILFKQVNNKLIFSLVDINRMRFKPVSEDEGYRNLRRLWLPNEMYIIIAKHYAKERGFNEATAINTILAYKNRFMQRKK